MTTADGVFYKDPCQFASIVIDVVRPFDADLVVEDLFTELPYSQAHCHTEKELPVGGQEGRIKNIRCCQVLAGRCMPLVSCLPTSGSLLCCGDQCALGYFLGREEVFSIVIGRVYAIQRYVLDSGK